MWTLFFIVLGFLSTLILLFCLVSAFVALQDERLAWKAEQEKRNAEIQETNIHLYSIAQLANSEQARLERVQQQTIVATQNFTRAEAKHQKRQQEWLQGQQQIIADYQEKVRQYEFTTGFQIREIVKNQQLLDKHQKKIRKLRNLILELRRQVLEYRVNDIDEGTDDEEDERHSVLNHAIVTPVRRPLLQAPIHRPPQQIPTVTLDFDPDEEREEVVQTPGTPDPREAITPIAPAVAIPIVRNLKSPNFQELETFYGRFLGWKPNTEDFDLLRIYTQGVTRGEQRWLNVISKKWNAEADPRQVVNNKYRIFGPKKTDLDFLVYILEHENVAPIEGLDTNRSGASSLRNECWERDARLAKAAKVEVVCFCCQTPLKKDNKWEMCHLLPRAHGGQNELSNVRVGCTACNRGEGGIHNMHALEYMILKEMPGLKSIRSTDRKLQAIQFLRQILTQFQFTFADIPEGIQKDLQPSNSPRIRILAIARYLQDRL
jgi:hypothetical protein